MTFNSFNIERNTAVIYHYFEVDALHRENFKYFLINGIETSVDYYLMIAGACSLDIPKSENIKVFNIANESYDVGGYQKGFKEVNKNSNYKYIFFINSGVLGPIVPKFIESSWTDRFTRLIEGNVKAVGTTINFPTTSYRKDFSALMAEASYSKFFDSQLLTHVPTMFLCIEREAAQRLNELGFFDKYPGNTKIEIVINFEIALTQILLRSGWNISSIQPELRGRDYRELKVSPNHSSWNGDSYFPGAFFGRTINPYDVIFFKTTRGLLNAEQLSGLTKGNIIPFPRNFSTRLIGRLNFEKNKVAAVLKNWLIVLGIRWTK